MTNFDPETQKEIVSENEAKEIAYELSSSVIDEHKNLTTGNYTDEMDVSSVAYLRNTYSHLHENKFRKINELLSENENVELKPKRKQRINVHEELYTEKDMDIENEYRSENSFSSEGSSENNEICELTKNIEQMRFEKEKLKPIITFTPVHSTEEEVQQHFRISPFLDKPSSGSSSPLLEVPVSNFPDVATEMMRPPIN